MPESGLIYVILIGTLGLFGIGLVYFVFIGVRAIFRSARQTASAAGHGSTAAALRATLRMALWSAFFAAFYLFLYVLGRWLGWWAAIPGMAGLAAMIWALLQADRLLTVPAGDLRRQFGIGASLVALLGAFLSAIWLAVHAG
jgi:hypothetical protein